MACPCCFEPANLRLNQINKTIGCPECKGQFEADPDAKLSDVIRISAACSVTNHLFAVAFKRVEFGKHRFLTTFQPSGLSEFWDWRVGAIPIEEIDFGKFQCPWCESRMLDFCSKREQWICHRAHPTPGGHENICPHCGPNIFEVPISEMKIAEEQPMHSERDGRRTIWSCMEMLHTGSALIEWSGK
jgi:hypothetical protein